MHNENLFVVAGLAYIDRTVIANGTTTQILWVSIQAHTLLVIANVGKWRLLLSNWKPVGAKCFSLTKKQWKCIFLLSH